MNGEEKDKLEYGLEALVTHVEYARRIANSRNEPVLALWLQQAIK